jgi:hypothetical protein
VRSAARAERVALPVIDYSRRNKKAGRLSLSGFFELFS